MPGSRFESVDWLENTISMSLRYKYVICYVYVGLIVVKTKGSAGRWSSAEKPTVERGPGRGPGRLSGKGRSCGGRQGQRRLPYFFMRATLTEERQNEWPVRTNEKK